MPYNHYEDLKKDGARDEDQEPNNEKSEACDANT